jgi:rRNA-processing protein FCF1
MEKIGTYVFDTSYLIEYPEAVNNLPGNMVIPAIVLKQLDGLKNSEKEDVARRARAVSYDILNAQRKNKLKIVSDYEKIDMLESYADNVIVGTAVRLKETCAEVVLLTRDVNMKIAAESMGIILEEPVKTESTLRKKGLMIVTMTVIIWGIFSLLFQNNIAMAIILNFGTFIIMFVYAISISMKYRSKKNKKEDYVSSMNVTSNSNVRFDYNKTTDRLAAGFDK